MSGLQDYLSRLSISRKLVLVIISVVLAVALVACAVLILSAYLVSRNNFVPANVQAVTQILSEETILNTLLTNQDKADHILSVASEYSQISSIALYTPDGALYARFSSYPHANTIPSVVPTSALNDSGYIFRASISPGQDITFYIQADPSLPVDFYAGMTIAVVIILVFILLLSSVAASLIRRFITQPILHLIRIANTVSIEENYGVRAQKFFNDEIGILAQAFNTMLSRIEARDQLLTTARDKAERASLKAQALAIETHMTNKKLELEVQVRKRAERKVTSVENHLNDIIDSMPSALVAIDDNLCVTQWNQEATRLTTTNHHEAQGKPLVNVMPFLGRCMPKILSALADQSAQRAEKLPLHKDGQELTLEMVIYPLTGEDDRGAVIRLDNITRRLQLEDMMVQTEKMMSVGGLAAGMAHEINNPLGAIIQSIQNIHRRLSPQLQSNQSKARELGLQLNQINQYLQEREIQRFLENIHSAGVRASQIVSNMLQFSRQGNRILSPTNLSELIERTLEIARSDFNLKQGFDFMRIQIEKDLDSKMQNIPCINSEIQQVLLNLLKNAAQAITDRPEPLWDGLITLRTRQIENKAVITVKDNGIGMPEDIRKRIFEPFFTTKDIGSGTGLGLSVSYFIITSNHNGEMNVSSLPGEGTEFTITLTIPTDAELAIMEQDYEITANHIPLQ